ncbi:MAG: glycosyltransferase family 39 protein [Alphaproteobacteria bacterium]|nr:glycosyltransferase family 39 protein [Alphaproteobacteria bacterium]
MTIARGTTAAAVVRGGDRPYGICGFAAIGGLTLLRLLWLSVQSAGLYPDEAQYWFWAKHPAFGYYSKPPLVAWLIALTTGAFGDSEFAVRLAAPLLHAGAAAMVFATAARLYDRRTGFWAALAYATLPGVSLSAFIISTDAPLLLCWAVALYAFVRAREPDGGWWWVVVGIAAGLGLLAKYAMAYWLLSALGLVLIAPSERRHLKGLMLAIGLAVLLYLPNLWWNWDNGFVSYLHLRDNAHVSGSLVHPAAFLEFFASQFGVFGPLFFAALMAIATRTGRFDARARMLAVFALPTLAMMLCLSFLSRAQPNWAAPTYVSATILVTAWAVRQNWRRFLRLAIALNLAAAILAFCATDTLAAIGVALPPKLDPLHRLRGWHELGRQVGALLAAHPGLTLLADDRELLAALIYYVKPHPFTAVEWNPIPGITDQWRLTNNIGLHRGEDFLLVSVHNLLDQMRPDFTALTPLTTIQPHSGPAGISVYTVYIARNFRGDGRTPR